MDNNEIFKNFSPVQITPIEQAQLEQQARIDTSKLERSPSADNFSSSEINSNKDKLYRNVAIASTIIAAGALTGAVLSGRKTLAVLNNNKQIQGLLDTANATVQRQTTQITDQGQKIQGYVTTIQGQEKTIAQQALQIKDLEGILGSISQAPEGAEKSVDAYAEKVRESLAGCTLKYDPLAAPAQKSRGLGYARNLFEIEEVKPLTPKSLTTGETISPSKIKEALRTRGEVTIQLPKTAKTKPVVAPDAYLSASDAKMLGVTRDTNIKLIYGVRTNWSEEKIARDMLQNFYDGHGNTLDGVTVMIKKLPNGHSRIKISGEGLYNWENLQYIGSGSKDANLYNAGGFGEGAKVLVTNLLGKGDTSKVTFSCADWQLDFVPGEKSMESILTRTAPLQGNTIEFETGNQKLTDAIIDAVNYFQHSKNPDFSNVSIDTPSFAYSFTPGKKGNIYLTQRFEFGAQGNWQGEAEDMTIAFKCKPDAEKFRAVTGKPLPKDRDRTYLTYEDIENMTRYFASQNVQQMSDEDIIRAIVSTKPLWGKIPTGEKDNTALKSFLRGLLTEAESRYIKLDVGDMRVATVSRYANETVIKTLQSYNYVLLPEEFSKIGIPSATNVFDSLSAHTALQPTPVEVKKLKLLEQGVASLVKSFEVAKAEHLKKADIQVKPGCGFNNYLIDDIFKALFSKTDDVPEVLKKYVSGSSFDWQNITPQDACEISQIMANKLQERIIALNGQASGEEFDKIMTAVRHMVGRDVLEPKTEQYLRTLYDFNLVTKADIELPRYIFDRKSEIAQDTLGEAIVKDKKYLGHWVDREYLNSANYNEILATWLHEICHKSGGDGSSEFTYALTDLIRILLMGNETATKSRLELAGIAKVFDSL